MKKYLSLFLALVMALSMMSFASAEEAPAGEVKTASAQGFASEVKVEATVADGKITLSEGEISMVFTREKPEGIKVADVNPAAAAEDFEGTWEIAYVGYNGMIIDPSTTGQEMPGLVVENGAMKFTGNSSMSQAFGTNAIPLTFADGALGMSVSMGETSYGIKLEMLEDGMLALTANMGSTEVYMYFVKAAAEEPAA